MNTARYMKYFIETYNNEVKSDQNVRKASFKP